jgi:4-amino-4-deoxy-L-arabinose transferase-like glycosyltransferase
VEVSAAPRWDWPAVAAFGLRHDAFVLGLALLAYGAGARLTARCRYGSALERAAFGTAVGLGALSYLVFGLSLAGALSRPAAVAALAGAAWYGRREWGGALGAGAAAVRRWGRAGPGWAAAAAGGFILVPFLLLPLYPPTHWDATLYHLALAKAYAASGGMAFVPELRFSLFPQLNEMLFALALVVADDIGAQLIQTLMTALLALALWAWGRRVGSFRAGGWAAALLLANPIVIWLGSSAYIDTGVALFVALGCYAYWNWGETGDRAWLGLAGVCLGFAAASKYSALFWLALLAALTLGRQLRGRAPRGSLGILALGAAAALPWYLRSAYYSGNPIFPFLPQVFGQRYWSLEDIRAMLFDIGASYGVGHTLSRLVALPWHLAFNQNFFHSERHVSSASLILLPLVLAACAVRPAVRWMGALAALFTVWWFYQSQELRYLVPALPLYSLAAGVSLDWFAGGLARLGRGRAGVPQPPWLPAAAALLVGAALVFPGWRYVSARVRAQGPVPVTGAQRDAFLSRALPAYPAYRFLNRLHGREYTVYAVYNENMAYFADGKFEGDWFGPARYSRVLSRMGSSRALYAALRGLGADYLLISDWRRVALPMDRFFYQHFTPVFTTGSTWLFELAPARWRTPPALASAGPHAERPPFPAASGR